MTRLCIGTRGISSWRARLANPDRHWKRGYSAFETAVSWECAACGETGLPTPILTLLETGQYNRPTLVLAVAEHKVPLPGRGHDSQCDLWAVLKTPVGQLSLTVEAKAQEAFADKSLEDWLLGDGREESQRNRRIRWDHLMLHLPGAESYHQVRYQLLHRCAAAVIEAKRFGLQHAAFVVQAFDAPDKSFQDYAVFCRAMKIPAERGRLAATSVDGVALSIGWADCPLATDKQIADTA